MKVTIEYERYREVEFHADTMEEAVVIIELALKEGYKATVENERQEAE